jgi:hypothetical protein
LPVGWLVSVMVRACFIRREFHALMRGIHAFLEVDEYISLIFPWKNTLA